MLINTLKEVLSETIRKKAPISYCVWGKHGIGKTELIEELALSFSYKIRNVQLSQIDPTEILGFPKIRTVTVTKEDGSTETVEYMDYIAPRWFIDALKGNYIIFLDELNRAKRDVTNAAFELIKERRLNGIKLPDSVLIIAACNPSNSGKYDTIDFNPALIDRFCHIHLQSNFEIWADWAKTKKTNKQNINQSIIDFLSLDKSRKSFDFVETDDLEFPVECNPAPRSWKRVNDILDLDLKKEVKRELLLGIVGQNVSLDFFNFLDEGNKPITLEELFSMNIKDKNDPVLNKIKDYASFKTKINEYNQNLINSEDKIVEVALLSMTCDELIRSENSKIVKKEFYKVLIFLSLIPSDLAQRVLNKLTEKDDSKVFWEEKVFELKKDSSGVSIENDFVWKKLISNLSELKDARDSIIPDTSKK